jgi:hypothetical protein
VDQVSARDSIPAGFDFFETIAQGTVFHFEKMPIPAGFFSQRSEEFDRPVGFRGRPLPSVYFNGLDVSQVDTVVERKAPVDVSLGASASASIELVALALESIEPIEVKVGKRTELWDVQVDVSSKRPSQGQMSITKTDEEGGVFDADFLVLPVLTFTRQCDGKQRILDVGALPVSSDLDKMLTMRARQAPWRHTAQNVLMIQGLNDNFGPAGATVENNEVCSHGTQPPPECKVTISAQSQCLCLGKARSFTANGSPSPNDGTYSWTITQGQDRAKILSGANRRNCEVQGVNASSAANDIRLKVTYQPPGGGSCAASIGLSTIDATLSFSSSGALDQDNDTRTNAPADNGWPQLGPVSPGSPASCKGFRKNIEIRAKITPADRNLPCKFNFKRTRQSIAGDISPAGNFIAKSGHCPLGGCDDDLVDTDEDLTLSTAGTIFVIDSPGIDVGSTTTACAAPGWQSVLCANFTERLEVDGQQCGQNLLWHAETRIECRGSNWTEIVGGDPVGQDHIVCSLGIHATVPSLSVSTAVELLESDLVDDRVKAYAQLVQLHHSGQLQGAEGRDLRRQLREIAGARAQKRDGFASPLVLAIALLGLLQDVEAVPIFLDHLLSEFQFPVTDPHRTLAGQALANLGSAAVPGMIERAGSLDHSEWRAVVRILQGVEDQQMVRRAVCAALDSEPGTTAEERLDDYLRYGAAAATGAIPASVKQALE